jgi:hypothetical protein
LGLEGDDLRETWLSVVLLDARAGSLLVVGFRQDSSGEFIDHQEEADEQRARAIARQWRDEYEEVAVWKKIE